MYKRLAIALALLLVLGSSMTARVSWAQGGPGVTYQTGFQLQNLSASIANVAIQYYNQAGTVVTTINDTIPANGSKTYFPIAPAAPFNGSVVVSADQQLVAIANQLASGAVVGGSATGGFSSGATSVNLPLIMRNNSGFSTFFNVQNAGSAAANVNVTYTPASTLPGGCVGAAASTDSATINPGAAHTFDQFPKAALGACFVGSASVTANQPVVATVEQLGSGSTKALLGYNGFTGSSNTIAMPLIMANNSGFFTGVQVQNTGGSTVNVTVTYSPNTVAGMGTPVAEVKSVAAGQSATFLQSGGQWTGRYVGSARVAASPAAPLVAIVNQLKIAALSFGSAYEGFNPASATSKVSAPLVMANNSGYFTGIQIQNVGGSTCNTTVTYAANTVSGMGTPIPDNANIAPNASVTFLQNGGQWTARYIGSAVISGTSCSLLAIINELSLAANDQLFTYDGFNY